MTLTWTGSGGVFTRLGKIGHALNTLNTARGTTVPAEVEDALDEVASGSVELRGTVDGIPPGQLSWQSSGDTLAQALTQAAEQILIRMVYEDNPQPSNDIQSSLEELIRQMVGASQSVDASTASITSTAGSSNVGDGVMVVSAKRADGKNCENALAEDIIVLCTSATARSTSPPVAKFQALGEAAADNPRSHLWPLGSGIAVSVVTIDAGDAANLILNGDMEDEDDRADTPDDWIISVGTIGTTVKMTNVEVQTVAIASDPTSGYYVLNFTDASRVQTTNPLAYDASSSTVQEELRKLKGLELITVAESGTSPNFTHTITFTGKGGNLAELTSSNTFDTGTITHATTTAGTAYVYQGGKAFEFDGNGSELTQIRALLLGGTRVTSGVQPLRQYAVSMRVLVDTYPAAGVFQVDLFDGNAVINDQAGTANSFTFNPKSGGDLAVEATWYSITGVFRTPKNLPPVVYLRIHQTTAVSSGSSVYVDHVAMVEMTELYPDGPSAACFHGATDFQSGTEQVEPDKFTLAVSNDRAGTVQEFFNRAFGMANRRLLLPSNSSGSETIADSVIG